MRFYRRECYYTAATATTQLLLRHSYTTQRVLCLVYIYIYIIACGFTAESATTQLLLWYRVYTAAITPCKATIQRVLCLWYIYIYIYNRMRFYRIESTQLLLLLWIHNCYEFTHDVLFTPETSTTVQYIPLHASGNEARMYTTRWPAHSYQSDNATLSPVHNKHRRQSGPKLGHHRTSWYTPQLATTVT